MNLLQPQDRRSLIAGDPPAVVAARARLEAGLGVQAVMHRIVERAATLLPETEANVVDLGSGTGAALAMLANTRRIRGVGIDLSTSAAEHAASRFQALTWIVANADRRLPLLNGRVDLVLSLHARRNPAECARVLRSSGHLLVAVPAHDDLIEIRAAVQGQGLERDRTDRVASDHAPFFTEIERVTIRERIRLDGAALRDLLEVTYRGGRISRVTQAASLEALDVTMASALCLFRPTS